MASLRQLGDTRYHRGDDTQQPEDREGQSGRVGVCLRVCARCHKSQAHTHPELCRRSVCSCRFGLATGMITPHNSEAPPDLILVDLFIH